MKIPSWWPHENTGEDSLTKRVEQLEIRFGNMWEDCCNMWGRIKSLEQQSLWNDVKNETIQKAVRDENNANKRKRGKK